jgi:ABC-type lipoprotein export system ATPase subunit
VNFEVCSEHVEVQGLNRFEVDARAEHHVSTSSEVVVSLRSVELPFGAGDQVAGVNCDVTRESFVAVSGPSGAGKSLLLQAIAGSQEIVSGEVTVYGTCALFAQHVGLALSVREAGAHDEWIDRLGLHEFADRPMDTLSGGQRQKSLLAIALSSDAQIVLLDDPTGALDEENRELVIGILQSQSARTIIVASNDELIVESADVKISLS